MELNTKDVFAIVNTLIIQQLEQDVIPWKQTWRNLGPPRNLITGRPYRGINHLLLGFLNYASNEFLTFRQVKDLGGSVKKGEKAHLIVFWHWPEKAIEEKEEERRKPILRYYFVFNRTQCNNLPSVDEVPVTINDPIEVCEEIIARIPKGPEIVHRENEAYYNVTEDFINMPRLEMFFSSEEYYACLFHEEIHATGHINRLNRKEIVEPNVFASESYSIEELTAEIGACYLTSYAGIMPQGVMNHVAYIQCWLKRLKEDKRFIVYAAAHAQKAADYLLNIKHGEEAFVNVTITQNG